jgi:hypothetical protein
MATESVAPKGTQDAWDPACRKRCSPSSACKAGIAAWAFVAIAYGQAPRPFPAIDAHVPVPPAPLIAGARTHLGHTPEKVV